MPIVFVHAGYSPYLEFSLRQARACNPEGEILLLGNPENDRFPFIRHVDGTTRAFEALVTPLRTRYRHLSTNRRAFELICFERWFRLQALFQSEGLSDAFVLDTDVMLYASEAQIRDTWTEGATLGALFPDRQEPFRWMASPAVSYWTAGQLDAFCSFVLDSYSGGPVADLYDQKWAHHVEHGIPGGICDMTALYLFASEQTDRPVVNFAAVTDGLTCDLDMNYGENTVAEEYAVRHRAKQIEWDTEGPLAFNRVLDRPVHFQALHFSGKSKARIPDSYRGEPFTGQAGLARSIRRHYTARRAASALLKPFRSVAQRFSTGS